MCAKTPLVRLCDGNTSKDVGVLLVSKLIVFMGSTVSSRETTLKKRQLTTSPRCKHRPERQPGADVPVPRRRGRKGMNRSNARHATAEQKQGGETA